MALEHAEAAARYASASAARAAPRSGAPKLVDSTLDLPGTVPEPLLRPGVSESRDCWNVKLTRYPDGYRAAIYRGADPGSDSDDVRSRAPKGESDRFESSKVRSRSRVRHLARCIAADHMVTFTKRGKFATVDSVWDGWGEMNRLCAKRFGSRWSYVSVPEQHGDGTWHMHVAVHGFFDVTALRVLWYRALGCRGDERGADTPGAVNITSPKRGRRWDARSIASYITGYVGKGFDAVAGCRRLFASSKGIRALEVSRFHFPDWYGGFDQVAIVEKHLQKLTGIPSWDTRVYGAGQLQVVIIEEWRDRPRAEGAV